MTAGFATATRDARLEHFELTNKSTQAAPAADTGTFQPSAVFTQTCGFCGCVFRVEVERARVHTDLQEYSCPECHHHECRVHSSVPPRLTVIERRREARRARL